MIGWKECEIPEDCLRVTLTFQARLYRNRSIMYQDGAAYRQATERGETTSFEFTLKQNNDLTHLHGSGKEQEYTASVKLTAGHIDLRGRSPSPAPYPGPRSGEPGKTRITLISSEAGLSAGTVRLLKKTECRVSR